LHLITHSRQMFTLVSTVYVDRFMRTHLQDLYSDPYHALIIQNELTRNLGVLFPHMRDEIVQAFDQNIPPSSGECSSFDFSW